MVVGRVCCLRTALLFHAGSTPTTPPSALSGDVCVDSSLTPVHHRCVHGSLRLRTGSAVTLSLRCEPFHLGGRRDLPFEAASSDALLSVRWGRQCREFSASA